ncbi:MAG: response regulator [Nitrospinae bacterium]|nr:response regulator [Nitrospinota bacterium]
MESKIEKTYQLLLIDDDETDRTVFRRYLKQSNMKSDIQECSLGQAGINEFQAKPFDCVFLDYQLPDENGLEVLNKILEMDLSALVVMLTGMGDENLAVELIKAGASDYIPKDNLSSAVLLRCLQSLELKKAKETAERNNLAKSEFLSRMSHELRTPMNAILGFAQLMNGSKNDPLPPIHQKRAEQILIAGEHLLTLLNEILDLSKIESGNISVLPEPLRIAEIIKCVIAEIQPLANQQNIRLINETVQQEDFMIEADRTRLTQVLFNIISNGIKYNIEDGSVTLDYKRINNETLQINIKDTGIGVPKEKMDRLFEPFDRLGVENSGIEGVGIGLTISKTLVSLMGGTLDVCSVVGEGSHFYIRLPLVSQNEEKPHQKTNDTIEKNPDIFAPNKNIKILYIEDNCANLELVKDIFSEYPHIQFLSAPNGKVGIEQAQTHQPDLILMDINMPEMDGYEALKHLKKHLQTKEIPVIALSANAMQKDMDQAMEAGFNLYITKPINISKFKNTVAKYL